MKKMTVAFAGLFAAVTLFAGAAAAQDDRFAIMASGVYPLDDGQGAQVYELSGLYMIEATRRLSFGIGAGIGYADVPAYYSQLYNDVAEFELRRETWTVPLTGLVRLDLGLGRSRPYLSLKAVYRFSSVSVANTESVTSVTDADGNITESGNLASKKINPFVVSFNPAFGWEFPLGGSSLAVEAGIEAVSSRYQCFAYKTFSAGGSGKPTATIVDDTAYKTKDDGSWIGLRLSVIYAF